MHLGLEKPNPNSLHWMSYLTFWAHMDNSICHNGSKVVPKIKKHHLSRFLTLFAKIRIWDYCVTGMLKKILKDHEFTSNHEIEEVITSV
jgi:hypothetical protein